MDSSSNAYQILSCVIRSKKVNYMKFIRRFVLEIITGQNNKRSLTFCTVVTFSSWSNFNGTELKLIKFSWRFSIKFNIFTGLSAAPTLIPDFIFVYIVLVLLHSSWTGFSDQLRNWYLLNNIFHFLPLQRTLVNFIYVNVFVFWNRHGWTWTCIFHNSCYDDYIKTFNFMYFKYFCIWLSGCICNNRHERH